MGKERVDHAGKNNWIRGQKKRKHALWAKDIEHSWEKSNILDLSWHAVVNGTRQEKQPKERWKN